MIVIHKFKIFFQEIIDIFHLNFSKIEPVVLFNSFSGQYNDNPKYISEKLHELYPKVKIVWAHSEKCHEILPSYIETVEIDSPRFHKLFCVAKVVVDNHIGYRSGVFEKKKILLNLLYRIKNRKRKGQLSISTWHGTPLKKIGMDEPGLIEKSNLYCSTDYVLSGSKYLSNCLVSAFLGKLEIKEYGTPRNDILFLKDIDLCELKSKLALPTDKKILLYAPTFRNNVASSGVEQMSTFDFYSIFKSLSQKFGGEWCFVYRVHNLVQQSINKALYLNTDVIDGNLHDDMAEYLMCADVLVTDYSASMFDFALTKKPCFLYTPDIEHYCEEERGFYLPIKDLPFKNSRNNQEFIECIDTFNSSQYEKQIKEFNDKLGIKETGDASLKIVNDIIKFLN